MESIEPALLGCVMGGENAGPNRTKITTGDKSVTAARTDYGYCLDMLERNCTTANTGFFGTNTSAAAQCVVDKMPKACPATLSGAPQNP
jgi:hypothetical protein